MDVGDVIKTGLDNDEQVECITLIEKGEKQRTGAGFFRMDNLKKPCCY